MSRASDGRVSALAHLALTAIKKGDEVADLRTDRLVLAEIKAALRRRPGDAAAPADL